jgi:hypothetical protein
MTHQRQDITSACRAGLAAVGAALLLAVVAAGPASAHHGWAWAVEEQSELKGTIKEISMAPPHPVLRVEDDKGALWQVDLGNPAQTERSNFKGDTAKVGDAITVLGNRHKDADKKHMKAVRITIGGTDYDMYPERLKK